MRRRRPAAGTWEEPAAAAGSGPPPPGERWVGAPAPPFRPPSAYPLGRWLNVGPFFSFPLALAVPGRVVASASTLEEPVAEKLREAAAGAAAGGAAAAAKVSLADTAAAAFVGALGWLSRGTCHRPRPLNAVGWPLPARRSAP